MKGIKKVVIPIAGYGSRMFPTTLCFPKAVLPIVNKPAILYLINECINANIEEVIIVISDYQEDVKYFLSLECKDTLEKFKDNKDIIELKNMLSKIKISFVVQEEQNGLGDAINTAKSLVGSDDFGVILGDNVIGYDNDNYGMKQLISLYKNNPAYYIGVKKVEEKDVFKFGIVGGKKYGDVFEICEMIEKPKVEEAPSNYAIMGRYILKNNIFDYLSQITRGAGNELQLTDAIYLALNTNKLYAVNLNGNIYDIGSKEGFVKANIYFLHY